MLISQESLKSSHLFILGSNGKAENYPTEVSIREQSSVLVGIENHDMNR